VGIAAATAPAAATERKRRRFVSMGVFVGGVLCRCQPRSLDSRPFWLGLKPGRKLQLPLGLPFCYTISMKKARAVKQKVMGRPRTGITPLMGFRADPVIRASIVRWAERQPDMPSLSEAIRRLVELGLKKGK
jgi:hypothetical protein